jgi:hypothetical protein
MMVLPNLEKGLLPYCHSMARFNANVNVYECDDIKCVLRKQCGFYQNEVYVE